MAVTEPAAKMRYVRALRRLRQELEREGVESDVALGHMSSRTLSLSDCWPTSRNCSRSQTPTRRPNAATGLPAPRVAPGLERAVIAAAVAAIAVPAAAFADQIGSLIGLYNHGTTIPASAFPSPWAAALVRDPAFGNGEVRQVGHDDGITFYAAKSADGHYCVGIGFAATPSIDALTCGEAIDNLMKGNLAVEDFSSIDGFRRHNQRHTARRLRERTGREDRRHRRQRPEPLLDADHRRPVLRHKLAAAARKRHRRTRRVQQRHLPPTAHQSAGSAAGNPTGEDLDEVALVSRGRGRSAVNLRPAERLVAGSAGRPLRAVPRRPQSCPPRGEPDESPANQRP